MNRILFFVLFALPLLQARAQDVDGTEPNRGGDIDLSAQDPAVALQRLTPAEGYAVNLFASEKEMPAVGKPVAIAIDGRGRLWVGTMPTYPQIEPGKPPTDKILILEDTDGDGVADKHTVFADGLNLVTGFELGDGGAYVAQQPNLVFLKDTDGDDVADERTVLLHGFGTEDSHHAMHAFQWGPDGALYFQEGTFHHTQVETPYGPVRAENAAVFRYEPETERFSVYVSYPFANPWGHVFDEWGQNFIADASGGSNYFALPITGRLDYPDKHPNMRVFTSVVRPTAGAEIISSRHFPPEAQGNFIIPNTIGFHGIKNHKVIAEGSGFTSEEQPALLVSSDRNFRPIDIEFGADGALYIVDWFNPLIGHMQYSMRDPRRDTYHGRIWRLTYPGRPLVKAENVEGRSVPELLDLLRTPEERTRYRVRRELRLHDKSLVQRELAKWTAALNPADADYERALLEALWAHQARDLYAPDLLNRLLNGKDHRARAAATRVLRYWTDQAPDPVGMLRARANDAHPLVRLEAVVALSYVQTPEAAEAALDALNHPMDYYLEYGLKETIRGLEKVWKPALVAGGSLAAGNTNGLLYLLNRLKPEEVSQITRNEAVDRELARRSGIAPALRQDALASLAAAHGATRTAEVVAALKDIDGQTGTGSALADLTPLLASAPAAELGAVKADLERLATTAADAPVRRAAFAALLRSAGVDAAWTLAAQSDARMADLLDGIPFLMDEALLNALYPRVSTLVRQHAAAESEGEVYGRYVRLEQFGCCVTQSMAEVEVLDGTWNLAPGGKATQKSTGNGGDAARAIDGNNATDFRLGSVSQSVISEADPWWEVDLGEAKPISRIAIWKRTDGLFGGGMGGFNVHVLDSDRKPVWVREKNSDAGQPIVLDVASGTAPQVRRAAVRALAAFPGREADRFDAYRTLLEGGTDRDLAAAGLEHLLASGWKGEGLTAAADPLLAYARTIPASDRSGRAFKRIAALSDTLAGAIPEADAARLKRGLEALSVKTIRITAVVAAMEFDLEQFSVEPGQEVEIILVNPDHMPHNLVLTAPGADEKVGRAADAMASAEDGFAKNFVPDLPEVLQATKLIGHGETATLRFRAPEQTGDYPYICSFPGHWITMKGTMQVVSPPQASAR